eukprot:TRINITY_DN5555_c0_g1_i1.p1 TRINITY_DN5555_c0_g1~~TRINITY_DN5555_c0_g1_i1.p1  ORF type:complete len:313 (+),score=65.73 TRINITY_DN5555_c0_g1_i1:546-1484(+)
MLCYRIGAQGPSSRDQEKDLELDGDQDELNEEGTINVFARDADEKPALGSTCTVHMEGSNSGPIDIEINDNGDGSFTASYNSSELTPGEYCIEVQIDNQPIKESPFKFTVKEVADPSQSYAVGAGLMSLEKFQQKLKQVDEEDESVMMSLDDVGQFTIFVNNSNSDPVSDCKCEVKIEGPTGLVDVDVKADTPGTFIATYNPYLDPGEYIINILVDGNPIRDTPVTLTSNPAAEPSLCYAKGGGLTSPIHALARGEIAGEFEVYIRDKDENPVQSTHCESEINMFGPDGPINVDIETTPTMTIFSLYVMIQI